MQEAETVDQSTPSAEPAATQSDSWYLTEGVPGQGPRPDFLEPKYKTVAEQAKAYKEARKALGALSGAPEAYDLGEYTQVLDPEHPALQDFMKYAKENRFSNDAVTKIAETFAKYQESQEPDLTAELEKLGPQGKEKVEVVNNWAKNNLSEKAFTALSQMPQTAETVELMDEIRQMYLRGRGTIPTAQDHAASFKADSEAAIRSEMNQNRDRYYTDPVYRAEISRRLAIVKGEV